MFIQRQFKGGAGETHPPFHTPHKFLRSFAFFNHFEELQIVLSEVELAINNTPLIYVYSNTIEACLTRNYLLFDR